MPDAPPATAPLSPMFIWTQIERNRSELGREIDKLNVRIDRLDEYGTRGVDALRTEVARLRSDFVDHESSHEKAAKEARDARLEQASARRWLIGLLVTLTVPIYPAIGTVLFFVLRHHG